ncbi:hypothetical protein Q8A64_00085 [Oxalobacteraceae bacterium R-40]|uniref:Uncharacterized protein n=1 Tax=Keguizhuia sedimenti TaxID=3064264 RepID=A0ABU1BL58_9BURK|nr:hypothetical protein [Oxalobacteraceae bacterium R-40]
MTPIKIPVSSRNYIEAIFFNRAGNYASAISCAKYQFFAYRLGDQHYWIKFYAMRWLPERAVNDEEVLSGNEKCMVDLQALEIEPIAPSGLTLKKSKGKEEKQVLGMD